MTIPIERQLDVKVLAQHWMMRCVENGVPLYDYLSTTDRIECWDDWCREWELTADERSRQADDADAANEAGTAAELRLIAALEYHFGKFLFLHDLDTLRTVHKKAVASYQRAMADLPWPALRFEIAHAGTTLPAILRLPTPDHAGPHPVVVVVPGLDATKEEMHRFQEVFLARGLATVTLDGPGQGESEYETVLPADWELVGARVIDAVAELPSIDAGRIAMVGVSLGGYFAARTACTERRLRATAIVGGCYSVGECWENLPFLTQQAFQVRAGAANESDAHNVSNTFSLQGVDNDCSAPVLVVHGERDRLFGPQQAVRLAQHFGNRSELVLEPEGNHVLHNLAYRVRPLIADWIARQLGTPSMPRSNAYVDAGVNSRSSGRVNAV